MHKPGRSPSVCSYVYCCCCCCCSQTWTTYPTLLTSSSAWVEMEPCCTHPRSSRCVCVGFFFHRLKLLTDWSFIRSSLHRCGCHTLSFLSSSAGERSSGHGLPPGLAGLSDAFQIRNLPVSGHPGYRRYSSHFPPVREARRASRVELTHGFVAGNAAIVLRSRLKVRVLKENREKRARVDDLGVILTNGDVESSRKVVQYQVTRDVSREDLRRWMF